ncbi:MAG: metal ABC transporter permease [Rickettsiaceae bacterium]|nr:metal ABC transporter permease [Rickettsiaceae bacterium]
MLLIALCLIFISLSLGIIGPCVLWNKMENVGDALSHSMMLALVINFLLPLDLFASSLVVAFLFAIFVELISNDIRSANSTKIISVSCLFISLAILASDFFAGKIRIKEFMLGDILAVTTNDLYISIGILISIVIFIYIFLDHIVLTAIAEECALNAGVSTRQVKFLSKLFLFLSITISAHIAGILLISALITIPASIARFFSYSPRQMVILSGIISLIFSLISLCISFNWDIAYAPMLALSLASTYLILGSTKNANNY